MMYASMRDELSKIASTVSSKDAVEALGRLRDLESSKPKPSEIARGALAGGVAGTASSLARGLVSGGVRQSVGDALKAPTAVGKVGRLAGSALQGLGTSMAGSAAFGATLPFVRRRLDQEAEKAKLREYLGVASGGKIRREAKKVLGV